MISYDSCFHSLQTAVAPPERLNNPFCYEPHALCKEAARLVEEHLSAHPEWAAELVEGKMLGVLVCRDGSGQLGFLAAYSGQLQGREDWPWFVPAVFDYLQPDGHFKQEEARITALNQQIDAIASSEDYRSRQASFREVQAEAESAIDGYRQLMTQSKAHRDALRAAGVSDADLTAESQFQKAELRRLKRRWQERIEEAAQSLRQQQERISLLKEERHRRSDALQRWLFDQFVMVNERGERRTLTDIFAPTPQQVPPSGAGECCAPKLLQYAFLHGLKPLSMAEFWHGRSPKAEVRHHGQYYPACRGKCKPILEWMLHLESSSPGRQPAAEAVTLRHVAEDEAFLVIEKPAGLLSVEGLTGEPSVESILKQAYGQVFMVHRLDQDTSGLMVVARTRTAYHNLQQQFLTRSVCKKYVALLDGELHGQGTISLPLRPDPLDRPRQVVDFDHGKEAVTDYRVLAVDEGRTRIELTPHTGRTHQLRMHCAHQQGLATPIVGDRLYGHPAQRLCLHAAELAFRHPLSGQPMHFTSTPDF